jgi:glycosyltransferase involved in cell wall biosynthesis
MHDLVKRKTSGLDIPIVTIPNWAELESVSPSLRSDNTLLAELGLRDKFVLLYAGNLGHPNDLESMIECADKLREDSEVHFVFLGAGVKRKWLESQIKKRELRNVTLLDPRPRAEQTVFLNACDIGVVSLVSKMLGVSMPSRTYNILAAGKPILALTEQTSELARVVAEDGVGWIVPPGNAAALVTTIKEILGRQAELPSMGERARQSALEKYSLETAIEKYRKAI